MVRNLVRLMLLGMLATACTDASAPTADAALHVESSSLVATINTVPSELPTTWVEVTVPVTIHNTGAAVLHYSPCSLGLDAQIGETWETAWRPVCLLDVAVTTQIGPGESLELSLMVRAALDGNAAPPWRLDEVEGTYRVIGQLAANGATLTAGSNTFTLTVAG